MEEIMLKESTFKGLIKGEIESVFDQLNGYGLDLLSDVISAWGYDHEEDSEMLINEYNDMRELKEDEEKNEYLPPLAKIRGLKKALSNLTEKELQFLEDLLEIDPYMDNPYTNYKKYEGQEPFDIETVGINPYDEIRRYVEYERNQRFKTSNNTSVLFATRYNRSMHKNEKPIDTAEKFSRRYNRSMYGGNVDTNNNFSKRFERSMKLKKTYKPGDLSPYSR